MGQIASENQAHPKNLVLPYIRHLSEKIENWSDP